MTLAYHREDIRPSWLSDDMRFAAEESGRVWEIEWDYSFDRPANHEELSRPHIKGFLDCRRALAGLGNPSDLRGVDRNELAKELLNSGAASSPRRR